MPNLLSGLNIAMTGLLSQQQVIDVINQNVANASTEGYHRQRAVLSTRTSYSTSGIEHGVGAGSFGAGVDVDRIDRFNVEFFNTRYRNQVGDARQWQTQYEVLSQVESALNETSDSGLMALMDEFWASWSSLAGSPADAALRSDLLDTANTLTDAINSRMTTLTKLQADQELSITERLEEINSAAEQIANLNTEITRIIAIGDQPNDLLDERDRLLDRLSEIAGVQSYEQENGEVYVSLGGHTLVMGHDALALNTTPETQTDGTLALHWMDGADFNPTTGELAGLLTARDEIIVEQKDGLDSLANAMMTAVNALHTTAYDIQATPQHGLAFFTGTGAGDIKVNPLITNGSMIAVSSNATTTLGDGEIGRQIAALATTKVTIGSQTITMGDFYNQQITNLGLDVKRAKTNASDYSLAADALDSQRESVFGVNLDEEAANLTKAQKAYQAAARILTAIDELLDTVINGMGVVGR